MGRLTKKALFVRGAIPDEKVSVVVGAQHRWLQETMAGEGD